METNRRFSTIVSTGWFKNRSSAKAQPTCDSRSYLSFPWIFFGTLFLFGFFSQYFAHGHSSEIIVADWTLYHQSVLCEAFVCVWNWAWAAEKKTGHARFDFTRKYFTWFKFAGSRWRCNQREIGIHQNVWHSTSYAVDDKMWISCT